METSMSQIPSPSRFLNLPLEIKNEIYAYVLICNMIPSYETGFRDRRHHEQDTGTSRSVAPNPNLTISGNPRTKLALLRVNRQIHDEAALMFYGQNVFPIEVSAMSRRPRAIGAMRPNQPRREYKVSGPGLTLDDMPGLRTCIEYSLEAGYIFSLGPWKSTFIDIPRSFEKTQQEFFDKCKTRPEFRDDILQKMMQELDVELLEGSFWGKREGVLTVFLPMPEAPHAPVIPPGLVPSSDR
ncbi:hypothetical protein TWF679_008225 [Orbilia oligospora]|uniref:Uncharacterized protein n=1 Tax=Orbilia oligospora TaxID=2813651 RepID=A0A8H8V5Z6_ORBOL|nr:hypothetical protein TWF679_008225 [Orbilia oligospora]